MKTTFWYKFYADDMVVVMEHNKIAKFLKILINKFKEYDLIFNAKKSAIVNIKGHKFELKETDRFAIPYSGEYKFLGIKLDEKASIEP